MKKKLGRAPKSVIEEYRKQRKFDTLGMYTGIPVSDERMVGMVEPETPTQDADDL